MSIVQPTEEHTIDGIRIVFQLAPETEAPAEMHMFYPEFGVLNMAENACSNSAVFSPMVVLKLHRHSKALSISGTP